MNNNQNCNGDPNKVQVDWTSITTSRTDNTISIPTRQEVAYAVREDGVYKVTSMLDQYAKEMDSYQEMVMSREVFVKAYNAYIKGDKE